MTSNEFCYRCQKVTPSRSVDHHSGTEWLCAVCGWQVDFDCADDCHFDGEDDGEPVGSCENCETNIYPSEDDGSGLCDQCQWHAAGCPQPTRKDQ